MKLTPLLVLTLAAGALSCAPDPTSTDLHNRAIVLTLRDPAADYTSYKTFAIVDKVPYTDNKGDGSDPIVDFLPIADGNKLIDATVNEMVGRGYVLVDKTAAPDLGVQLSASQSTIVYGYYYPGYWYGGWYGYGWYYPAGGYYYGGTYEVGTLLTELVDLKNPARPPIGPIPPPGNLTVLWASVVYGVSSSDKSFNMNRALEGIGRSFDQSLYLAP